MERQSLSAVLAGPLLVPHCSGSTESIHVFGPQMKCYQKEAAGSFWMLVVFPVSGTVAFAGQCFS